MGAWGTSIFSDDNAADLREDYRDLIGNGLSGSEATDRLIEEWQPDGNDGYFVATFWLALALTQWKCGRLEERVKAEKAPRGSRQGAGAASITTAGTDENQATHSVQLRLGAD